MQVNVTEDDSVSDQNAITENYPVTEDNSSTQEIRATGYTLAVTGQDLIAENNPSRPITSIRYESAVGKDDSVRQQLTRQVGWLQASNQLASICEGVAGDDSP